MWIQNTSKNLQPAGKYSSKELLGLNSSVYLTIFSINHKSTLIDFHWTVLNWKYFENDWTYCFAGLHGTIRIRKYFP